MEQYIQGEKVMAIFRPTEKATPANFLGIIEVGIINYADKSKEFEWADVFIEVELSVKNSEYSNKTSLLGSLDKDASGNITGGSVLKRMYKFFDAIGCSAGLSVQGKWEDANGVAIENIEKYLNDNFTTKGEEFVAYAYKKKPKPGSDKVYTEVYPRLYPNSQEGKEQCRKDVAWLKQKGIIKEADATDMPMKNNDTP